MSTHADSSMFPRRSRKSVSGKPNRENATVDIATLNASTNRKKSRSKSMGPGAFDPLKSGNGNRRASLAAPPRPPPKSILKPTMPILPTIPAHKPKSKRSDFTIDLSQAPGTKIALRTEEEQQAAARERDERERLEQEVNDRREARRKSLANRRVSFATEATLHTFHEDYIQDSTSSTDSTRRRRSSVAQSSTAPPTNPSAVEADDNAPQRKRRRSSMMSTADDTIASTVYSSDSEHGDEVINEQIVEEEDSDLSDDGTMMSVEDVTYTSIVSPQSRLSGGSEADVDEALDLARQTARSNAVMDDEEEEIVPGLAGWGKKAAQSKAVIESEENLTTTTQPTEDDMEEPMDMTVDEPMEMTMDMNMEMTRPMGGIITSGSGSTTQGVDSNEDMSMDVTRAMGGILSQTNNQTHRLNLARSSVDDTILGQEEEGMEFTIALGGIHSTLATDNTTMGLVDEDMSMEMTTVMGRVLQPNKQGTTNSRRHTMNSGPANEEEDEEGDLAMDMTIEAPMDMTVGLGHILPTTVPPVKDQGEATMAMDMTIAVGGILGQQQEKFTLSKEDDLLLDSSPFKMSPSPTKQQPAPRTNPVCPALGAFQGKGLRRSLAGNRKSISPQPAIETPKKGLKTATIPRVSRSPSPKRVAKRPTSPQRRTPSPARSPAKTPAKSPVKSTAIFDKDPITGVSTPRVTLTPRRLSGVGVDRTGLGSPKVSAILDRRTSISDAAIAFSPVQMKRTVAFADPRVIEDEVDKERGQDLDREDSRKIMELEADDNSSDKDVTSSLKEMIQSLSPSPKYRPLRGRKSLAVGAASGLLGKRPLELDDSDNESNDGVKRLKGHQGSPVKNVRLQQPPSKAETTGSRMIRSASHKSLDLTNGSVTTPSARLSPIKNFNATTPKDQGRFKDVEDDHLPTGVRFEEPKPVVDEVSIQSYQDEDSRDRIHLQDFLNMTTIRFMELNTTKRRATAAPESFINKSDGEQEDASLEQCVVAGACTVPMLELYQHSCHELKKYISEGRKIIREIEFETFEVNPPLFREYISATPEFKVLMDNQFKNVKTYSRLQSKAMWYEWRMKLQDGLKEGLLLTAAGMDADDKVLTKENNLLSGVVPALVQRHEELERQNNDLRTYANELADCDPEELDDARQELHSLDQDIEAKKKLLSKLRGEREETDSIIDSLRQKKEECLADIKEAEKCRGWSTKDIDTYKTRVDSLEKKHGWAITGVSGTVVSMTYKRDFEIVFDTSTFKNANPSTAGNLPIDLHYVAGSRERYPQPNTPEKEFFLHVIREHVQGIYQASTHIKDMLSSVANAWDVALTVARDVRLLTTTFPTSVLKTSPDTVAVKSTLVIAPVRTKVEVVLSLRGRSVQGVVEVGFHGEAKVVYGEKFNEGKMGEFLKAKIDGEEVEGGMGWCDVLVELRDRLIARGRKG